jgi:hypothetical protein
MKKVIALNETECAMKEAKNVARTYLWVRIILTENGI